MSKRSGTSIRWTMTPGAHCSPSLPSPHRRPGSGAPTRRRADRIEHVRHGTATLALAALPDLAGSHAAVAQTGLPPLGAEIPRSMLALDTPMQIDGEPVSVDFRGGIKNRVDVNPDNPLNSVRLRVVGFNVTGTLPAEGDSQEQGTVTFEQCDIDVDAKSTLTKTQEWPPRYDLREVIPFQATIDKPGQEPEVLVSKEPMVLVNDRLSQFPTRGDLEKLEKLEKPVELVNPDSPDKAVATLDKFPVKTGGL